MAKKGFSTTFDSETTACARGKDMNCSPKASRNIAATIKGMKVGQAKTFLEEVIAKKTAVPYRYRYRKIKHRKGEGFGPGAYPVNAASKALKILENAENNAEYKGLDAEDLRIVHASAYVGTIYHSFRPRAQGRATAHNEETTNLEIVLAADERLDALEEKKAERQGGAKRGGVKATRKTPAKETKETKEEATEEKSEEVPAASSEEEKKPAAKATQEA